MCLTSPNGVRLLFSGWLLSVSMRGRWRARGSRRSVRGRLPPLRGFGVIADVVPSERFVAEGLVEALADIPVKRALVARAASARDVLPTRSASAGPRSTWWRCMRPSLRR